MISRYTLSLAITVIRLSMGSFTKTVIPSEDKEMPLAPMKLEKSVKNTENGDMLIFESKNIKIFEIED